MEVGVARVASRPTCSRSPFGPAGAPLSAPARGAAPPGAGVAPPVAGRGAGAAPPAEGGGTGAAPPAARGARSAEARRRRAEPDEPDELLPTAILVTGYPPYTKPQDLAHAFCKFGSVRLNNEWVTATAARLEFTDAAHARAAVRASRAVNVYGAFLTVAPCVARAPPPPRPRPPRAGQGNGFKGPIVEPKTIPLQGTFHQQLDALLCAVRLTQPEIERLAGLYRDLEYVLSEIWPGCRAIPFGSVSTGLGVKWSDADCFVPLPAAARAGAVGRARRALAAHPRAFAELLAIPRANTPIVKFLHLPTRVYCDLTFKTELGSRNSELVSFLLSSDPRLLPVAVVVKYWARVHGLTGTGKLTNYALAMLLVFYFQRPPSPLLPPVEWLQRDRGRDRIVDSWNAGFANDPRRVPRPTSPASIAELLGGFFEYYAKFDFEQFCVCPFLGRTVRKDDFRDPRMLPDEFARYKANVSSGATSPLRFTTAVCVQDPFEQCHNVASSVSSRLAADIRAYFEFAANAYEKEKFKDFSEFLPTILLEKPDLPRAKKGGSEFRARLPPGLIGNIAAPDWKSVVRNVAFQVFETILRVELTKIEEEAPAEATRSDKDAAKDGKPAKTEETPEWGKASKTEDVAPGSSKPGNIPKVEESALTGKIAKSEESSKPRRKLIGSAIPESMLDENKNQSQIRNTKPRNKNKPEEISKPGQGGTISEETAKSKKENVKMEETARPAEKAKPEEAPKEERKETAASPGNGKLKGEIIKRGKVVKPGGIARKEKEKYMGKITKAIWKRKMFSKLYSVMGLKFLDRETMITDEIMKVDKNVFDVKFQVVVTFNNAPRSAVVSIRHVSGELNWFKEFGKFFNNTFQHWFVVLYKPHCKSNTKNPVVNQNKALPAVTDEEAAAKELNEAMKRDLEDKSDSDSDSVFSYEDERIDPNAEVNSEVFEREDSPNLHDAAKINKNKSNRAVKKQVESEKAKKCDTNETDNKMTLSDQKHDREELTSDKSPGKGKNKQYIDKNEDHVVIDHLNEGVESLKLSEKSPQKCNKICDKNRHAEIGDQNESLNTSDKLPQYISKTRHGDNKTNREIDNRKTRHRNRKFKDKTQSSTTETGDKTNAGENGQMP